MERRLNEAKGKTDSKKYTTSISGDLIGDIRSLIETARHTVAVTVNAELPKRQLLEQKLHKALELARKRLEAKPA